MSGEWTWVNPVNPLDSRLMRGTTAFDANDRAVASTDERAQTSTTLYDMLSRTKRSTDSKGNYSEPLYDRRGLEVESIEYRHNGAGAKSNDLYPPGRAEYTMDAYVPGTPDVNQRGSRSYYDPAWRDHIPLNFRTQSVMAISVGRRSMLEAPKKPTIPVVCFRM